MLLVLSVFDSKYKYKVFIVQYYNSTTVVQARMLECTTQKKCTNKYCSKGWEILYFLFVCCYFDDKINTFLLLRLWDKFLLLFGVV